MSEHSPNGDPRVQRYRIDHLYQAIEGLQRDLKESFGRLESKLDTRLDSQKQKWQDHDKRIRKLENKAAMQMIINAILAALGGAGLALAIRLVAG